MAAARVPRCINVSFALCRNVDFREVKPCRVRKACGTTNVSYTQVMNKIILLTAALVLPVNALAQTKPAAMPMSNTNMSMKAPTLKYSAMPNMNMMMAGNSVDISAATGYKLLKHRVRSHTGTLTYASTDAKGLFDFYNKALSSEGWKEDMGMKMGMMKAGTYAEAYTMKTFKLDLMTQVVGSTTVVTVKTH